MSEMNQKAIRAGVREVRVGAATVTVHAPHDVDAAAMAPICAAYARRTGTEAA